MKLTLIKKKVIKFFIIFSVCLSLLSNPASGNEVIKMLECASGVRDEKIKELDAEGEESGELEKS